jgi:hypothetical protein
MNDLQRKRQMQAVHAQFKRMAADGTLSGVRTDSCHLWATDVLGRVISTLTACADFELNALRDTLNGKPPKIHARLRDVLERTVKNPDGWVNYMMHNAPKYARYADRAITYTVEAVPLIEAYRLLMQSESRSGDYRKSDWKPLNQQRNAPRVADDQRTLWGM